MNSVDEVIHWLVKLSHEASKLYWGKPGQNIPFAKLPQSSQFNIRYIAEAVFDEIQKAKANS